MHCCFLTGHISFVFLPTKAITYPPPCRHPLVCGITLLDLDHTAELGDSLEAIAWHKAGISKPDHPLITHPQTQGAMEVIAQQARQRQVRETAETLLGL